MSRRKYALFAPGWAGDPCTGAATAAGEHRELNELTVDFEPGSYDAVAPQPDVVSASR